MISKRKMALSLLVGVPLALHGHPLDISRFSIDLKPVSATNLSQYRTIKQLDLKIAAQIHSSKNTKFELLKPKPVTASKVAEPVKRQAHTLASTQTMMF